MKFWELAYICRLYEQRFGRDDGFKRLGIRDVDLGKEEDAEKMLDFLNGWGMRIGRRTFDEKNKAFAEWWEDWSEDLAEYAGLALADAQDATFTRIAESYEALRGISGIGRTGASKILFALLPELCPAWDGEMQRGIARDESVNSYSEWLGHAKGVLQRLAVDASRVLEEETSVHELPSRVGRDSSTPAKIVDEFYWVVYTARHAPPSTQELSIWLSWADG